MPKTLKILPKKSGTWPSRSYSLQINCSVSHVSPWIYALYIERITLKYWVNQSQSWCSDYIRSLLSGEVGDISAIMGVGPDSSPIIIIAISPVPSLGLLLDTVPHETVVLQQALDLHQPAPHQLILSPGVQPAELHFGEEVLVTNLDMIIGAFYVDAFLFAWHSKLFHTGKVPLLHSAPRR